MLASAALVSGASMLATGGSSVAEAAEASDSPAQELVRVTTVQMLNALDSNRAEIQKNQVKLYTLIEEIMGPHFDLERMSRRALGKNWKAATPEQRKRFVEEFGALLVRTYATAIGQYDGQEITYLPTRERGDKTKVSVRTELHLSGGPPIPINYEMYEAGGTWKVYDVTIDGVSLVINYRSTFGAEIRQKGMDGLIERLAAKNISDTQ